MTDAEKNYELYLEKYCKQNDISKEKAKKHSIVKEVKEIYDNDTREVLQINSTFMPSGECK